MSKSRWTFLLPVLGLAMAVFIAGRSTIAASAAAPSLEPAPQAAQAVYGLCYFNSAGLNSLRIASLPGESIHIMVMTDGPAGYLTSGYIHSIHEVSVPGESIHIMVMTDGPAGYLTSGYIHSMHEVSVPDQNINFIESVDGTLSYDSGFSTLNQCR